jgi:hypothetical protein
VSERGSLISEQITYGLDDQASIPGRGKNFSLSHGLQMSCGVHSAFFSAYWKTFHWGKAAGASKKQVVWLKKRGTSSSLPLYSFTSGARGKGVLFLFDREVGVRTVEEHFDVFFYYYS